MTKVLVSFHLMLAGLFGTYLGQFASNPMVSTPIPVCHTVVAVDFTFLQEGMKQFALDPAFQALHPSPLCWRCC